MDPGIREMLATCKTNHTPVVGLPDDPCQGCNSREKGCGGVGRQPLCVLLVLMDEINIHSKLTLVTGLYDKFISSEPAQHRDGTDMTLFSLPTALTIRLRLKRELPQGVEDLSGPILLFNPQLDAMRALAIVARHYCPASCEESNRESGIQPNTDRPYWP